MFRLIDSDNYGLDDYARNKSDNRFKVFGKGAVTIKPDAAELVIGVITENSQLEIAQEENANKTQQVINSVLRMGLLAKYIQTENYNIRSNYDYIDGKQVFRDYEVSNNLKILIRNIDLAGEIIDTAVKNGANNVSGINFIVSDQSTYYYEALRLAVTDAQNKANVMADKLKVKLDIIPIQINEQERGIIAPLGAMTFKNINVTTPIEVGENKIIADIEAVFKYSEQ